MRAKRIAGALIAALSLGALAMSGIVAGASAQADPVGDEAESSATVDTKELCIWYVSGVPDSFTLAIADSETIDEYDGSELDLVSGESTIVQYVSGNTTSASKDAHADCTFYGANEGIALEAAVSAAGFTASAATGGPDDQMDFAQSLSNPLELGVAKDSCRSGETGSADAWELIAGGKLSVTSTAAVLATSLVSLTKADTVAQQSDTDAQNSACSLTQSLSISVPANKTPQFPSQDYTFTGPNITFSFDILG